MFMLLLGLKIQIRILHATLLWISNSYEVTQCPLKIPLSEQTEHILLILFPNGP
jgi:hypothetical protein